MLSCFARKTEHRSALRAFAETMGPDFPYSTEQQGKSRLDRIPELQKHFILLLPFVNVPRKGPEYQPGQNSPHQNIKDPGTCKYINKQYYNIKRKQSIIQLICTISAIHETCQLIPEISQFNIHSLSTWSSAEKAAQPCQAKPAAYPVDCARRHAEALTLLLIYPASVLDLVQNSPVFRIAGLHLHRSPGMIPCRNLIACTKIGNCTVIIPFCIPVCNTC